MDACSQFRPNFDITHSNWPQTTEFGIINRSVGWLLVADKDWVVLADELDENGQPRGIMNVPTCIVLEIEILRD